MVFTNYGAQALIWRLGSALGSVYVDTFAVGSGSGTALIGNTTLVNEFSRIQITGSPDFTTARKVTFTADFASTTLSGTQILEFGLFQSGPANIGSTWQREGFGSIVFDGTSELQIISTIEAIPG